jgi:Glycosyl hydrolase 2 galactose-binding domain-like/Exo-beta-D-glucosaminidase Ig-fold domain/Glycosyl hydrolases family 2/Glycosyl hydrolases family 2, TIM barrel domain
MSSAGLSISILALLSLFPLSSSHAAPNRKLPESIPLTSGWKLQDASKVSEVGDAISRNDYRPENWHQATVPGTILTSLVNDGVYPEPLYGLNNTRIPDSLCRASYWYRTSFTVPQSYAGKQVWINFNGINYIANVWVNGHEVGDIKGAFVRGIFDVTSCINIDGSNTLAVQILPEPNPGVAHQKTIAGGTGLNGGVSAADGPTFLCSIGWDWIPTIRDRNMGIWQDVTLSASGPVLIQNPYVTSQLPLPRTDSADLTVQATVSNVTATAQTGIFTGVIEGVTFHKNVSLGANKSQTIIFNAATTPALHFKNPRLWWPNGYGPQNLYTLHLNFSMADTVSDDRKLKFGVRQIGYTLPGSDNLALSVNGVPVVAKGGDWGMDEAMKRIPRVRLDAQIRMHQQANYTIIRNWVGQSTSEDFYELCDKYGILVWDEFFQPNPSDGPNPNDADLYLANVREKILRFRSHPCIVLWCARNEGDPPPLIGQGIKEMISALDPGRLYQPNSADGRGVNSHGPYHWRPSRDFYSFHAAFKTEIGSMSVPTLEAIHAMMPSNDWGTFNDDWAEHDFCAGAQQGNLYPGIIASRYGPISSMADFVRKSQLANYEAFRAMYEGRFAKLFHPVTGIITWMSNPAQPSFVWQLYSHDLEPNAALFATRKACEPIHIQMNQDNWHVMVINNTPKSLTRLTAKTSVYDLDGKLRYSHRDSITATPSAATDLGAIAFPDGLSAVHFVKLELRDARNRLLSDNFYWRETVQDDFQALNTLPMVALDIRAKLHEADDKCVLNVALRNPSKFVALMTHLQLRNAHTGQRVLPVFYSDNYISLLPGENKKITVEFSRVNLGSDAPLLAVDGWNVTVTPNPSGNGIQVIPNADAEISQRDVVNTN